MNIFSDDLFRAAHYSSIKQRCVVPLQKHAFEGLFLFLKQSLIQNKLKVLRVRPLTCSTSNRVVPSAMNRGRWQISWKKQ